MRQAPDTGGRANRPAAWVGGPRWVPLGLRQPGWLLLPLRAFLAATFIYAGLQKLADPAYLDPDSPTSVVGQMRALRDSSPIGALLGLSLHAPTLVGLMIAFGEFAVGLGALLGLWTRVAAVGGMLLSLTFFLSVSWGTTPYYYGSDIVFFFAWTVIAAFGAADVLSLDAWLRARARPLSGVRPVAWVPVEISQLRRLCGRSKACGLQSSGYCTQGSGCPVFPPGREEGADVNRRTLLLGARTAGLVAIAAGFTALLTAALGRRSGSSTSRPPVARSEPTTPAPAVPGPGSDAAAPTVAAAGTAIGATSAVPPGQAAQFTDPATGDPAWVVHTAQDQFVAFSAVCTHAGCAVRFVSASMTFVCPCHGGTFDASTGGVLGGPAPRSLPSITVAVVDGQIRVD